MNNKYTNDYYASKDPNYIEKMELISFNFNDYILKEEQLLMTTLPKIGKVKIYIFGKEGKNIPHFHIIGRDSRKNEQSNIDCCVCLYENKYFYHGSHRSILNKKQQKILDKIMRSPSPVGAPFTNWQFACQLWYVANGAGPNNKYKFNPNRIQPNYIDMQQ